VSILGSVFMVISPVLGDSSTSLLTISSASSQCRFDTCSSMGLGGDQMYTGFRQVGVSAIGSDNAW